MKLIDEIYKEAVKNEEYITYIIIAGVLIVLYLVFLK